jgi:Golgi phosphoprotein 3 (GPP34)
MAPTVYVALERLAEALDRAEFATVLAGTGPRPRLTVTRRSVGVAESVYTEAGWYWWSWAERIGPVTDPAGAAVQVAALLRSDLPRTNDSQRDPHGAPGCDEIAVATPPGRYLCFSLAHQRQGQLAEVLVTFGQLGSRWQPDALWQDCWNRTYPMCVPCWDTTRRTAQQRRPGLVIHDHRGPVPPGTCPAGGVMSPGLEGTGRVGDDLWLLGHSDLTGRPCIQPRPLGLGLAGALLAEAALAGVVIVGPGPVRVGPFGPREELTAKLARQVAGEREPHPVGEWLAYVARTAPDDVAGRLEACGYLARGGWWPPWRGGRWIPTDRDSAFSPVLRIRAVLDASRPLTAQGVVLAGLADACGLGFRLAQYTPDRPVRPLPQAIAQLEPDLRGLVALTKAAVGSAVLAHRV